MTRFSFLLGSILVMSPSALHADQPNEKPRAAEHIELSHLSPARAAKALRIEFHGPKDPTFKLQNGSVSMLSATRAQREHVVNYINRVDVPAAQVGTKFLVIERKDLEKLIEEVVGKLKLEELIKGEVDACPLNIIAQIRTNRIFLMGRPVDISMVENTLMKLDKPGKPGE